jgi:hypothetical protein
VLEEGYTTADEVTIDTGEAEPLSLPFDVMATVDGAGHIQGSEGTTVYMDDNVIGAEPREVDAGLSILRQKVAGVCPFCGSAITAGGILVEYKTDGKTGVFAECFECEEPVLPQ